MSEGRVIDPETGEEIFLHPETGERLCSKEDWLAAMNWLDERMTPFFRVRRNMRDAYARAFPPAEIPAPRHRTPTQDKVARCPRCGGRLDEQKPSSEEREQAPPGDV